MKPWFRWLTFFVLVGCFVGCARSNARHAEKKPESPPPTAPQPGPPAEPMPHEFVKALYSQFQWWVDPATQKVNFRRCDFILQRLICRPPMLLRGIDKKDVPIFFNYYAERLERAGNTRLNQFIGVLSGSFGTATAYVGALTAVNIFKNMMPERFVSMFTSPTILGGFHILSIGTIGVLIYFTGKNLVRLYRQNQLLNKFMLAKQFSDGGVPDMQLNSEALFDEFIVTFRRALYEFTHNGPPFEDEGNLIFQ